MFQHSPTVHHGFNLSMALFPFISWLSHAPEIVTTCAGLLSCVYYTLLIYDKWKHKK